MEAQFVTICHMPRTHRVCVYKGIPKIEMEKLLSSVFKTGNRRIVGLMCDQNDVVPLAVRFFNPHSHLFDKLSKFIKCMNIVALYI